MLLYVIKALDPPCALLGGVQGWQQQGSQYGYNRNYNQELDECEPPALV